MGLESSDMEEIGISKKLFLSGIVLLVSGFATMAAGSETYGFWKITVAPVAIVTAFGLIAYAIMHKKRNTDV